MHEQIIQYAGDTIEVTKKHTNKCPPKGPRQKRTKPTSESVKKFNAKLAEDCLRLTMNHNFTYGDLHIVLGYRKNERPDNKTINRDKNNFLRKMRAECKKLGIPFKYIYVTGYYDKDGIPDGDYSEHDETSIHHHFVMSGIDYRIITKCWVDNGRTWLYPLYSDGDYSELATYFFGHTKNLFREDTSPSKKRWSCSRNLKKLPPPKKKVIKADSWTEYPKAIKGYKLVTDSIKYGVSEVTGYAYQFYRMVKIQETKARASRPDAKEKKQEIRSAPETKNKRKKG